MPGTIKDGRIVGVSVEGDRELIRALGEIDQKARTTIVKRAARNALKPVLAKAKQKVPVRSGDLKASLRISVRSRRGRISAAILAGVKKTKNTVIDAFYAHMVEYGHQASGWFSRKIAGVRSFRSKYTRLKRYTHGVPDIPAKPFIRPAWDEVGDDKINESFQREVWAGLEKTFAGK